MLEKGDARTWTWELIQSFFETKGFAHAQLKTFNEFISQGIDNIFAENDVMVDLPQLRYRAKFSNTWMSKPMTVNEDRKLQPLLPYESRSRDLTYEATLYCDIEEEIDHLDGTPVIRRFHTRQTFCALPVMVGSWYCHLGSMTFQERIQAKECPHDPLGYFLIRGKERELVGQVRQAYNTPLVVKDKKEVDKYRWICKLRSMSETSGHSTALYVKMDNKRRIWFLCDKYITAHVPLAIVLKAYGVVTQEDMINCIGLDFDDDRWGDYLDLFIQSGRDIQSQKQGLEKLAESTNKKSTSAVAHDLEGEILPHMGTLSTLKEKAYFLGNMARKLILTDCGARQPDDMDNYSNKRVELAGQLCQELFRTLVKRFVKESHKDVSKLCESRLEREASMPDPDIIKLMERANLTSNIRSAFTSKNWGLKTSYQKEGVSQVLLSYCYAARLSYATRISLPYSKERSNYKQRQVHPSQNLFIDPFESPEGEKIGIVLNLAWMTTSSARTPLNQVRDVLEAYIPAPLFLTDPPASLSILVMINGVVVGWTLEPSNFVDYCRELRRTRLIHDEVSLSFTDGEVRIWCDDSRLLAPVFTSPGSRKAAMGSKIVLDNPHDWTWDDIVERNYIQYLDSTEMEQHLVIDSEDVIVPSHNTYPVVMQIMPMVMMMGYVSNQTPFSNHIPASRNVFQTSMSKQIIGTYSLASSRRYDTMTYELNYPQRESVTTTPSVIMGMDEMIFGTNAVVAILSMGWNQEDGIIISQAAIDRGMFRGTTTRTITAEEQRAPNGLYCEIIGMPPPASRKSGANYGFLDERGIINVGSEVKRGDVLVAKYINKTPRLEEAIIADSSYVVKKDEEGRVVSVMNSVRDGCLIVKVKISRSLVPEVGDKFASRSAQKGVCALLMAPEDLPFTSEGIVPDIIINTHALPSRMTMSVLMEGVAGKVGALSGTEYEDATPYLHSNSVDELSKRLAQCGYDRFGREQMYCGTTGEPLEALVFIGIQTYLRLKHLAAPKAHCSNDGARNTMFHQPLSGRKIDGALRMGEMERDNIYGHGMTRFGRESLMEQSDPAVVFVCKKCGLLAGKPNECLTCGSYEVNSVNMPYVKKQLNLELAAVGVKMIFNFKE